jgi:hypothetical protein
MRKMAPQTIGRPELIEPALNELVRFIAAGLQSAPLPRPKVSIPPFFPFLSPRV